MTGYEYPTWLVDTAFIVGGLALPLSAVGWFIRREINRFRDDMVREVKRATAPIQPDANGGKSMPDIFTRLGAQDRVLDELRRAIIAHVADDKVHHR